MSATFHLLPLLSSLLAALAGPPLAGASLRETGPTPGAGRAPAGRLEVATEYSRVSSHRHSKALTLELAGELALTRRLGLFARMPFALASIRSDSFNLAGIGNATAGLRVVEPWADWCFAVVLSGSAPTASRRGDYGYAVRVAANNHVARDPSLYLPGIAVARLGAGAARRLGPALVGAHGEARRWMSTDDLPGQTHLQSVAFASIAAGPRLDGGASLSSTWRVAGPGEAQGVHGLELWSGWQAARWRVSVAFRAPLDAAGRRLGLFGIGTVIERHL